MIRTRPASYGGWRAIAADGASGRWLAFGESVASYETHCLDKLIDVLSEIESRVESDKLWAVGWLSYEAGPAFDPAIAAHTPDTFPLLHFELFAQPEILQALPAAQGKGETRLKFSQDSEAYRFSIQKIRDYIAAGDTYQVNYTTRLTGDAPDDAFALFCRMAQAQQSTHAAFIHTDRWTVCSASPELFFERDGETVISRPMKGTAPRGRWSEEDEERRQWLARSEKNRAENVMIVDMVRNDLGRVAPFGQVETPRLFDIERYPTVWQMTSTVCSRTEASQVELLRALFPAASITGAPKIRTSEIIRQLEPTPRRVYTGAVGWLAPGRRASFNVAIRTVLIDHETHRAEYGVGSGIVWDSDPDEEYRECRDKCRVLETARPDFALFETMLWQPDEGWKLFDRHLRRLQNSCAYFNFPFERDSILDKLVDAAQGFDMPHRVRLVVSKVGKIDVLSVPIQLNNEKKPVTMGLSKTCVNSADVFLYHKTTNRVAYESAAASRPDCQDVILLNERNEITESCIGNLLFEREGKLLTPCIESGLLPGTLRSEMLEQGKAEECLIRVEDLNAFEAVYRINSVRGKQPVRLT